MITDYGWGLLEYVVVGATLIVSGSILILILEYGGRLCSWVRKLLRR